MGRKVKVAFTGDFLDSAGIFSPPNQALNILKVIPNVEHTVFAKFLPEVTPEQIRDIDIVISRHRVKWTEQSFTGNNQLLSILRNGVAYEQIDVPALTNAGVMLCIASDAVRRPVATAIITFILALSTRLILKEQILRSGQWAEVARYNGIGLTGKTLGSIGVGNIGHEVFMLAKPFGMKHIACDPYITHDKVVDIDVKLVDLDTVLAESDFLCINNRLNEQTHHMIGEAELKKMKKSAYLINTARGPIVDEAALIKALREGWIKGAGLDVFEQEPTPRDNPLLKMDNVIVTPHAMAWTDEFFNMCWDGIQRQISQIIRGEVPEHLVNREVWNNSKFQLKLNRFRESII